MGVPVVPMSFLLIWCEICHHFYHPSAGKLSSFKTAISRCSPTFCCMELPPWGSIYEPFVRQKKTTMQNSGEPLCLEMEAIKLNGKARSSSSFMSIFSVIHYLNQVQEKNLGLVSFTSTLVLLWRASYPEMWVLLCYLIWFSSAFKRRQCCLHGLLSQICQWFYCL